ncbi:MAG: hypothetical protein P4L79_10290 [Legionella sp.]|uniref:hypothetical protein n=1 Tax=Legionella sp. TaxID=459 RepID=UPI0028506327|nr:hypothetical protein [Legionella sp.]
MEDIIRLKVICDTKKFDSIHFGRKYMAIDTTADGSGSFYYIYKEINGEFVSMGMYNKMYFVMSEDEVRESNTHLEYKSLSAQPNTGNEFFDYIMEKIDE